MNRSVPKCALWLVAIYLAIALALPIASAADGPLCLPAVVPLDGAGFVELSALRIEAVVRCQDGPCSLGATQYLTLVNTDQVGAATLRLGLGPDCAGTMAALSAEGAQAQLDGEAYRVTLPARGTAQVTATVSSQTTDASLVVGTVAASQFSRWGKLGDVRLVLEPNLAEPGAWLDADPAPQRRSADRLTWDWQGLAQDVACKMLNPAVDAALLQPEADGSAATPEALVRWLAGQQPEQVDDGLVARLLAALHRRVASAPDDTAVRLLTADAYLTLAEMQPDRRLNDTLLAIDALRSASETAPSNPDIEARLAAAYYQAAMAADQAGDPANAIAYLNRAAEMAPSQQVADAQAEFVLRWGLDLARQGQVSEAVTLLSEAGQLPAAQNLTRFAPPLVHAETEVVLAAGQRRVTYDLMLYGPATAAADEALLAGLAAAQGVPGVQATLEAVGATARRRMTVVVDYHTLDELRASGELLVQAWRVQGGLLAELLAAPWQARVQALEVDHTPWGRQLLYDELVDTAAFHQAWQVDADYANWWMIELHAQQPESGASATEHELSLLALRDQVAVWQALPANTRWVYSLDVAEVVEPPRWLLGSGEERTLSYRQTWYDWPAIGKVALGLAAALAASVMLVSVLVRAARRRRAARVG